MNTGKELAEHLKRLRECDEYRKRTGGQTGWGFATDAIDTALASAILANRSAHINALVVAGVLKPHGVVPFYSVVQPRTPRCTAWVDVGKGYQNCTREQGHEGVHTTGTSGVENWNRPDVMWGSEP